MRAAFHGLKAGVLAGLALAAATTLCAQSASQSGAGNAPSAFTVGSAEHAKSKLPSPRRPRPHRQALLKRSRLPPTLRRTHPRRNLHLEPNR